MSASAAVPPKRRAPRRHWLIRALIWFGASALLVIAFAAAWAWSNRYALIERQTITYLGSLGIDADLSIRSADGQAADIRNIRLSHDGKPFLEVGRLQAAYQWRDLLNGQVERLDFSGLDAVIEIDANGQIVDGWLPPTGGGDGSGFPVRGIGVTDGSLRLTTPWGTLPLSFDAEVSSTRQFGLDGILETTTLERDGLRAALSGPFTLTRDGGRLDMELPDTPLSLSHPSGSLSETVLFLDGIYDLDSQSAQGRAALRGGRFVAAPGTDSEADGRIDQIAVDGRWQDGRARGTAELELRSVRLVEAHRRDALAPTLSLARLLEDVPVAQNFAPTLVRPVATLMSGSDVTATLEVDVSSQERRLSLREPMQIQQTDRTSQNPVRAVLSPRPDAPAYLFRPGSDDVYRIAADLSLTRPLPLSIADLRLGIRSADGIRVDGIADAAGTLGTGTAWQARTQDGRPARLGPLSVGFDYDAPLDTPSMLVLSGRARYDGDVPGGYVTGLDAGGVLTTELDDGRTRLGFAPNRRLRFDRMETTSDWTVQDFDGRLRNSPSLYTRPTRTAAARIGARLDEVTLRATRPDLPATDTRAAAEAAELALQVSTARLNGRIDGEVQDWTVAFETLALQSETFPVEGTDLLLPEGTVDVGLSAEARSTFALQAPSSTLETPLYIVRGMALDAAGTAERYTMDYSGGRVRVKPQTEDAVPLPILPVSGTLLYQGSVFTGDATTTLPRAQAHPIDINYRLEDGLGTADVRIDDLRFRPGGLQPQDLVPTLRGKIAQVDGTIDARLDLTFGADTPLSGSGMVEVNNVSLGTAPGPVTGLNGTVELTSLFPVLTAPDQTLSIATFNPGFPLENGSVTYALIETGVDISRAQFPLGEGQVAFDPFIWTYGAPENRVVLRVSGVEVGEFLKDVEDGRLTITGELEGTIPVVVRGIDVLVENGRLEVSDGGVIQIRRPDLEQAAGGGAGELAMQALRDFRYNSFFLEIDGPLDGDVELGAEFSGNNPDVLFGVPFEFDVSVEGELFNIARNLNPNALQQRFLRTVVEGVETPSP